MLEPTSARKKWLAPTLAPGPTKADLRVPRVTPAVTCQTRDPRRVFASPDVLAGRLHVEIDRPLAHDHVIQAGEGADRVRVRRGGSGDEVDLLLRSRPSSGRAFDLAGERGASTDRRKRGCADRSREP
jgi:hypothetical protein